MDNLFKIKGKNIDAHIFMNSNLFESVDVKAKEQLLNITSLPTVKGVFGMPDMHSGFGFPIGAVAGFDAKEGVVCPAGIGFDINCGMRFLKTNSKINNLPKSVLREIYEKIPVGLGAELDERISFDDIDETIEKGIDYLISQGYTSKDDKEKIEDYGRLKGSGEFITQRAKARGRKQLGTLGAGNHFIEIQVIDEVYDRELASKWGLEIGQVCIMLHSGSRGLGHEVASNFIKRLEKQEHNKKLVDSQLSYEYINSEIGQQYLKSMNGAANFAYANRQMMIHNIREIFNKFNIELETVYDVNHNIAKFEKYKIEGELRELLVHRKGATRALSANNSALNNKYMSTGHPVIIPGSMGSFSYILVGDKAEEKSFGSVSHGAGRIMSRSLAMQTLSMEDVNDALKEHKVELLSKTRKGAIQEGPQVYKDVSEVIKSLELNKLAKRVVRLRPLKVIKG